MRSLCLIGNSHLAAVKLGWDQAKAAHPGIRPVFFGSPGVSCDHTFINRKHLVPRTPEVAENFERTAGEQRIALNSYDSVVLVGLSFGPQRAFDVAATHAFLGAGLSPAKLAVSEACFVQAVVDGLRASLAARLARRIRRAFRGRLVVVPQPNPSIACLTSKKFLVHHAGTPAAFWAVLQRMWMDNATQIAQQDGFEVAFQPESTVREHLFTDDSYRAGARELFDPDRAKRGSDFSHMNADFGAEVLAELLAPIARSREASTSSTQIRRDRRGQEPRQKLKA